jgi:hypothetical protein
MKGSTKTTTVWEVCNGKREDSDNELCRSKEYGGTGEDFRKLTEAMEYAQEAGYRWVKEIAFAVDHHGVNYERVCSKRFYRVQPSVITAHARCCRCGQAGTFENSLKAYDWKFEHELMHNIRCVEAWESDLAYPGEIFPLRKRVPAGSRFVLVPITDTLEPESESSPAIMSGGEDQE